MMNIENEEEKIVQGIFQIILLLKKMTMKVILYSWWYNINEDKYENNYNQSIL